MLSLGKVQEIPRTAHLTRTALSFSLGKIYHSDFSSQLLIKYPTYYVSLMQGVRRWMGTQAPPSVHKSARKVAKKVEAKKVPKENESGDTTKNTTENVLARVMNPRVPESELVQYEG